MKEPKAIALASALVARIAQQECGPYRDWLVTETIKALLSVRTATRKHRAARKRCRTA